MIHLIIGEKGKGKTKILLDKANTEVKTANGNIVYIDKSKQHMYELNNRVRLIDITNYPVKNADGLVGFISGIISQDNDLEQVYLDSYLKVAGLEGQDFVPTLDVIAAISEASSTDFYISISAKKEELPERLMGAVYGD